MSSLPYDYHCKKPLLPDISCHRHPNGYSLLFLASIRCTSPGGGLFKLECEAVADYVASHNNGTISEGPLFGGEVSTTFPLRLEEVFVDLAHDKSMIFELLELNHDVEDNGSGTSFLQDLAREQGLFEGNIVTKQSTVFEAPELQFRNLSAVITTATAKMV
ncbi:unnamed protein product [Lactuca saligna]|uniref:Uncharacterized protein n=1 Tax=Lactuca saligna TaxID=75948 RepID=A0AA35YM87_LACSI|nr:unnamed protein product [Lactuca saligna]